MYARYRRSIVVTGNKDMADRRTAVRDMSINLRASRKQRSLIDRAAAALGKSRSDLMLEAACRDAESALLDRRYLTLDAERFEAFAARLDAPPAPNPKLRRLLAEKSPWNRGAAARSCTRRPSWNRITISRPSTLARRSWTTGCGAEPWPIRGAARTYVICASGRVVGYYALATGAVDHAEATGRTRRNMPNPVPVMVLGRLAIDLHFQGRGLGRALLRDAVLRTMQAADIAGIRAILVHAISEEARRFYQRSGFHPSPVDPMTLMITLRDAEQALIGDPEPWSKAGFVHW
jgi:uncharacterized protein (DUF1778 family)/GNAT superfamily N-acetyltransferase